MTQTGTAAIRFDREPCTRCQGVGRYSHNGEHDRCFDCNGKGTQLTRAAKAAQAAYDAACARYAVPAGSIAVGTEVWISRGPGDPKAWRTVTAVAGQGGPLVTITIGDVTFADVPATQTYRTRLTEGQRAEVRASLAGLPGWTCG